MTQQVFSRDDTLLWLQHLDIFSDVPEDELALLLDGMAWIELRSGDTLDADPDAHSVFIVRYGSLGSTLSDRRGARELAPVGPGEILGEVSVIAGIVRPTHVVALRHSGLLRVTAASFRAFMERSHRGTLQVTRDLARRLVQNLKPSTRAVRPGSIALVAAAEGVDLMALAAGIAADAGRHGLAVEVMSHVDLGLTAAEISAAQMLNDLTLLVTCDEDPAWNELCVAGADRLLFVDALDRPKRELPALDRILGDGRRAKLDVVTLCPATGGPFLPDARWRAHADLAMHVFVREGRAEDLGFLSRIVGGRAIGMVLAGGGARGFAHLGVIRAFREAGIPIDLWGGTSMGAIIAAGAALEWDDAELLERMRQVFAITNPVNDYTLPLVALTRGNKVATRLRQHFGALSIESTWRPFFAVSTNLSTCEAHVHRRGPVWRALRASSALPGILPPVVEDGHVLVDGAVMNNFPVDVMRDLRRGPVVGVAMPTNDQYASTVGEFEAMSPLGLLRSRGTHPISVFSVVSRTATASSLVHSLGSRALAELVIDPSVQGVSLMAWRSLAATAEAAYQETRTLIEAQGVSYASLLAAAAPPG